MLLNPFARSRKAKPKSRKRRNTPSRRRSLLMESLEDRRLLAVFAGTDVYSSGSANPYNLATADFNNDGALDIVAANISQRAGILLNNGEGTSFATSTTIPFEPNGGYYNVATGDFNNDGNQDFVATTFSGFRVWLGNGNGQFAMGDFVAASAYPIAVGDVDGDGNLDVVTATNSTGPGIRVFRGLGNGQFAFHSSLPNSGVFPFHDLALADMDNNGRLDVVGATMNSNGVYVALNDGNGSFSFGGHTLAGGVGSRHVAIGDLDGDGRLDVVTANRNSNSVTVFRGNGAGGLTLVNTISSGGSSPYSVGIADLDGDGNQDIAVTNTDNKVVLLLGNGSGTSFGPPGPSTTFRAGAAALGADLWTHDLVIGDFNNNGVPDIAAANRNEHTVGILLNTTPNQPPIADAGGPYTVEEGSSITLVGSGAVPDGTVVAIEWDLDYDGNPANFSVDAWGSPTAVFDASLLDGPLTRTVALRVTNGFGLQTIDTATVTVNNVAPQLQNVTLTPEIDENEFATLTGEFVDPGTVDTFTMVVDWGDGSPLETFGYPAGTTSFSETHQYLDDGASGTASHTYAVSIVSFVDDDGGSAGLVQGGNIFLTGHDILSHHNQNGFSVVVLDYLRGTGTPQEIPRTAYDVGVVAVNVDNYLGNLTGGSGVAITPSFLPDPRSGQTFGNFHTFTITSGTSAAQFESFLGNLDVLVIPEHGFANNNAKFNSFAPQLEDFFNAGGDLFIDSSNGQPNYYDFLPSVIGADGPGITASSGFSATSAGVAIGIQNHMLQYATHNTFSNPDPVFTIFELHNNSRIVSIGAQNVVISDGGLGAALSVTVHNVAPDFDAGPDETLPSPLEGAFSRIIQFADPGSLDVHTVTVNFGDGTGNQAFTLPVGDREFSLNHTFTTEGTFTVSVTVEDDDLGSLTDTFDVTVELNTPPIAHAGGPYTVPEGSSIQLDASGTFDNEQLNTTLVYEWDLDYDGLTFSVYTTGIQPTVSFPDNFASRTIAVRVTDDGGLTDIATTTLEVTNVAPQFQNLAITPEIDENDFATLTGDIVDPGTLDTFTLTVDWGDGTVETFNYGSGTTSFSETHQYPDDGPNPGNGVSSHVYTISVKVTDDDGGVAENTSAATVTVNNVAPIVTSLSSTSPFCGGHNEGQEISISAAFTDVGTLDTHVASVDWGDGTVTSGTVDQFSGPGTISASHTYNSGGVYAITVTVTDDDGGTATRTTAAMIVGAGVNGGVLYIVGTEGDDHVTVNRQGNGHFRVHANFLPDNGGRLFSTDGIELIHIILCDGDDHATVAGNITTTVIIDGGPGDDHLKGGGGSNILLGGPGNDTLIGGLARDILIGGTGNDRIVGQAGDDILVGGRTIYDADDDAQVLANDAALLDILALWNSSDDFGTRQGSLATLLNSSTVEDDEEEDVLTGGSGDDWLFAGIGDVITDLAAI